MIEIRANLENLNDVIKILLQKESGIFLLKGDVGAGKTTLVSEFIKAKGINEAVTSPTFSIMHQYASNIYHYDLYNHDLREMLELGLLEWLSCEGLHFVEWGDKLKEILDDFGMEFCVLDIIFDKNERIYRIFE